MTSTQLRRQIKRRIDELNVEQLPVADDFLAYLQNRENDPATRELLAIPGFMKRLGRAEREVKAGRVTTWRRPRTKR